MADAQKGLTRLAATGMIGIVTGSARNDFFSRSLLDRFYS
jgi:hypothetical protein